MVQGTHRQLLHLFIFICGMIPLLTKGTCAHSIHVYRFVEVFLKCAFSNSFFCCTFSIKGFWKVPAVLVRGKVKWQVVWCLLCSCLKHLCRNRELGLLKGHWTWGLLSASISLVKRAKRLFSVILAQSYIKVLIPWENLCQCCGGFSWVIFFFLCFSQNSVIWERIFVISCILYYQENI